MEQRVFYILALGADEKLLSISRADLTISGRSVLMSPRAVVDSKSRCIAFGVYDNFLQFAAIDTAGYSEIAFEECSHLTHVSDLAFLDEQKDFPVRLLSSSTKYRPIYYQVLAVLGDDSDKRKLILTFLVASRILPVVKYRYIDIDI